MADGWIIALVGAGTATALTLLDKENLLFNMNPGKKWFWERILPPSIPGTLQNQQQIKELVYAELRRREEAEARQLAKSKYSVTQPFPQGNFSQKGYPGAYQ